MTTSPSAEVCDDPAVRSLAEAFACFKDPRNPKGLRHPLKALLSLTVVALLCGEENPEQISRFAALHPELLPALGFRPPLQGRREERRGRIAPPSNDMIARALLMAEGQDMNGALGRWLFALAVGERTVSIDGKALRGQGGHVLSLYGQHLGHVLWQEDVGEKENELSALLRVLEEVLSRLAKVRLFTGDAGLCHKAVAKTIIAQRRHYLLQLKAPHTTDLALAEDSFRQITARPPLAETVEKRGPKGGLKSSRASSGATRR